MFSYLRSNNPGVIAFIVFAALLLWLPYFLEPAQHLGQIDYRVQPLDIMTALSSWNVYLQLSFSLFLWLGLAFFTSFLNLNFQMISVRNYLPALLVLLIPAWKSGLVLYLNPALAVLFLALAFLRLFVSYEAKVGCNAFFEAGMLVGVASLFYAPFIVFVLVLLFSVVLFQMPDIRNFLVIIIGVLTPWWFYLGIYYFAFGELQGVNSILYNALFAYNALAQPVGTDWVFLGLELLVLIISSVHFNTRKNQLKLREKRFYFVFLWSSVVTFAAYFLLPVHEIWILLGLLIPLSLLFARYFSLMSPGWKGKVLFYLFLVPLLVAGFYYYFFT